MIGTSISSPPTALATSPLVIGGEAVVDTVEHGYGTVLHGLQQNGNETLVTIVLIGRIHEWQVYLFACINFAPDLMTVYRVVGTEVFVSQWRPVFQDGCFHCLIRAERFLIALSGRLSLAGGRELLPWRQLQNPLSGP